MINKKGFPKTPPKDGQDLLHDCNLISTTKVKKVSAENKLYTCTDVESLTQVAIAIEYGRMNYHVFPCNINKSPIVDISLGLTRGFKDATSDLKKIAKIWNKYPDAAIGWALPRWIIVLDCDVKKGENKRPVIVEGRPVQIGLMSFQKLAEKLNLSYDDLNTLSQDTQSGGRQFIYIMPEGVTSFNCTGILPGLDIKGYLGYIILPNSHGIYGQYRFRNLVPIKEVPGALLQWLQDRTMKGTTATTTPKPQYVTDDRTEKLIEEIAPVWIRASGRRWKLGKAIAGALYREGWDFERADAVLQRLCDMIPNGREHRQICKWVYSKMKTENYRIEGFTTLRKFIEELGGEQDDKQ